VPICTCVNKSCNNSSTFVTHKRTCRQTIKKKYVTHSLTFDVDYTVQLRFARQVRWLIIIMVYRDVFMLIITTSLTWSRSFH